MSLQALKDIKLTKDGVDEVWESGKVRVTLVQERWVCDTYSTHFIGVCKNDYHMNRWRSTSHDEMGKPDGPVRQYSALEFVHDEGSSADWYLPQGQWYAIDDDGNTV